MPGATPNQAYAYPLLGDNPAALASVWATLAGQLETKGSGYDTDAARMAANAYVKVSTTNFDGNVTSPFFNVVEVNRNTPTDLSAFNGIIVNPGFWIVGSSATYTPANSSFQIDLSLSYSPADSAHQPPTAGVNVSSKDNFGTASGSAGVCMKLNSQQTLSLVDLCLFTSQTRISQGVDSGSWVYPYLDLWAFQMGDL